MQCPVCPDTLLAMTERQGIEIDYCPKCRGIWLDRGELDKLIERSADTASAAAPQPTAPPQAPQQAYRQEAPRDFRYADFGQNHQHSGHYNQGHYPQKKKKSWLSELFDD
ncbi:zf-TFIIB domain-containing protein [Malikia sp.]|uniref:TFIIB-type zinc ribbon-containing protein n=1 Tax=Malikia sp. TaxID=2070706 RepID=UPI0026377E33|nr:zf-TFIIB domain-containing protein [Malikia sp.]MDD2730475.1 zf-TFIIB domain-containing protein [Malikia sp.]